MNIGSIVIDIIAKRIDPIAASPTADPDPDRHNHAAETVHLTKIEVVTGTAKARADPTIARREIIIDGESDEI